MKDKKCARLMFTITFIVFALAVPVVSQDKEKQEGQASALAGINVSFKLDPRIFSGNYGGERWVSPSVYTTTLDVVDARAQGVDANGNSVPIRAEWVPADLEMVTVSPSQGAAVKITVRHAGESKVKVCYQGMEKELLIKAESKGDSKEIVIAQAEPKQAGAMASKKEGAPSDSHAKSTSTDAEDVADRENQKKKLSYALGANFAGNLKKGSIEVDSELLIQGFKDIIYGSYPMMTEHEVGVIMAAFQNELRDKQVTAAAEKIRAAKETAEKNRKSGEAFLAANRAKRGVVALESGLQYKILKAAEGEKPKVDDMVICNYRGTLIDGTEFDSSYKRNKPLTFTLKQVIKGWREALQLMPVGSKWQLFVPSNLAYGDRSPRGGMIGPNSTLVFEVELLAVKHPTKDQPGSDK